MAGAEPVLGAVCLWAAALRRRSAARPRHVLRQRAQFHRTGPRRTLPGSTRQRLMRASADQGRPVGRRGACCRPCRCPAAYSCPRGWRAALGRLRQSLAPVPDMPRAHPGCREVGRQARSSRQTRCRKVSRSLLASARRALQGACTGPDRSQPGVSSSRWTSSPWTCSPQVSQTVWVTSSWSR